MKFWKKSAHGGRSKKLMVRVCENCIIISKGLRELLEKEFVAIGYEDTELPVFYIFPVQHSPEFTDSYSLNKGRIALRAFIKSNNIPLGKYAVERFEDGWKVLVRG